MKHSNIYYITSRNKETQNFEFVEVNGIAVRNSHGLDLFRHKVEGKSHETVFEGMTGYKVCDIRPSSTGNDCVSSPKYIDVFLETYHQIDKIHTYERIRRSLEQMKTEGKLSPRYTEPDKKRPPKTKATNPDVAFSKCLYEKGKKHFIRIHNQDGVQLFKRKDSGNGSHFTVYAPCNGWMITLGSNFNMDEYIKKLKEGLDIYVWLHETFEKQIADPNQWVDIGVAEYLDRRDEADEHNAPIKAAREEKRIKENEEKENKHKEQIQKRSDKYDACISNAVNAIRNNEELSNNDIETLTGNVTSIILELMRVYNIEIPLKTKGWINSALVRIYHKNDAYTYSYYSKSRDSSVFMDYLNKLINAIKEV